MKMIALALLAATASAPGGVADRAVRAPEVAPVIYADWQEPQSLPRRFRNHCGYDPYSGRAYCSDHCGYDYQFYFCAPHSFGCCRVGFGYCDWRGFLRCHP